MPHKFPDTPIFDLLERESLAADRYVSPYTGITKPQLIGLFWALGEYMMRAGRGPMPLEGPVSNDPEFVEARRSLVGFYWRLTWPNINGIASSDQPVFNTQERSILSLYKYVGGCGNVSKQDVRELLAALGQYCLKAPSFMEPVGSLGGTVRLVHAHNALVSFRDRPFTLSEFRQSVRDVIRGHRIANTSRRNSS